MSLARCRPSLLHGLREIGSKQPPLTASRAALRVARVSSHIGASARIPVLAVIADMSKPGGKALLPLFERLDGRVHWRAGNDLESFRSWERLSDVEVFVVGAFAGSRAELMEELQPLCPKACWVHSLSAGVEPYVPVLNALPGGPEIPLTNAKGAFSRSLAEYALGAMLHFNKQVPRLQANRAEKKWEKFVMHELHGKTVGFVGFGDIAQSTARLCKAFGMRILALRNSPKGDAGLADVTLLGEQGRHRVFAESDYLVCSLPGGPGTYHFCGAAEFATMKPSGVFISLGRGTAVDEKALAAALQSKRIHGAALDVFEVEPLPGDSQLWNCENLLFSAHNADWTEDYMELTFQVFTERLNEFLAPHFKQFSDVVDKTKGY